MGPPCAALGHWCPAGGTLSKSRGQGPEDDILGGISWGDGRGLPREPSLDALLTDAGVGQPAPKQRGLTQLCGLRAGACPMGQLLFVPSGRTTQFFLSVKWE